MENWKVLSTLYARVTAMLNGEKFDVSMRQNLWDEAAIAAKMLESYGQELRRKLTLFFIL